MCLYTERLSIHMFHRKESMKIYFIFFTYNIDFLTIFFISLYYICRILNNKVLIYIPNIDI